MLKAGVCYAERGPELLYKNYSSKLIKHERKSASKLNEEALLEVKKLNLEWFRFSVSGSIHEKRITLRFQKTLRELCQYLVSTGCYIHFPVESPMKAAKIRGILKGLPIVVRRTVQSNLMDVLLAKDQVAFVVGTNKWKREENKRDCIEAAQTLRKGGKRTVICPAVIGSAKCGECTACADHSVDVVLYPLHP